jgi:hypothetical protein
MHVLSNSTGAYRPVEGASSGARITPSQRQQHHQFLNLESSTGSLRVGISLLVHYCKCCIRSFPSFLAKEVLDM